MSDIPMSTMEPGTRPSLPPKTVDRCSNGPHSTTNAQPITQRGKDR